MGDFSHSNNNDEGDVCSQGPIHLSSGADVFGDARGGSVTIAGGSGATISGKQTNSPAAGNFPDVNFDEVFSNDNHKIPYGPAWANVPFFLEDTRDLIINNGRTPCRLESGVYHVRNFLLGGGCELIIDGEVTIYVEGEFRFNNGSVANLSQVPKNFTVLVGDGPINVQGGNKMHASIYAPKADATFANGAGFFGRVIAKTLNMAGGAGFHFDESLIENGLGSGSPALVY